MQLTELRRLAAAGYRGFPTERNWYGWCMAFVRWIYEFIHDSDPMTYESATAGWNNSPPAESMDPYAAPIGAIHWFTAGVPDGDVKISLGGGRVLHAYRDQDVPWPGVIGIGEDEWESAAAKAPWMRTTYLGWTYGLGPGGVYTLPIEVAPPAPPLLPSQRQVAAEAAYRRPSASTGQAPLELLAPGTVFAPIGWETGETVEGNSVWFGHPAGGFVWSGGTTDAGTHDLIDITPKPPDPAPTPVPVPPAPPVPVPDPVPTPVPDPTPLPDPVPPTPTPPKPRLGWGSALVLTIIGIITALLALIRI